MSVEIAAASAHDRSGVAAKSREGYVILQAKTARMRHQAVPFVAVANNHQLELGIRVPHGGVEQDVDTFLARKSAKVSALALLCQVASAVLRAG